LKGWSEKLEGLTRESKGREGKNKNKKSSTTNQRFVGYMCRSYLERMLSTFQHYFEFGI
jgi:hypothetical protein